MRRITFTRVHEFHDGRGGSIGVIVADIEGGIPMKTDEYVQIDGHVQQRFVVHWGADIWWLWGKRRDGSPKYWGTTIFNHIFVRFAPEHPRAVYRLEHEIIHVVQRRRRWWVGFLPLYLWHQLRRGYAKNPLEVEAGAGMSEARVAAELVVMAARRDNLAREFGPAHD